MNIPKNVEVELAKQGGATVYHTHLITAVFPDGTTMSMSCRSWPDKQKLQPTNEQPEEPKVVFEQEEDVML